MASYLLNKEFMNKNDSIIKIPTWVFLGAFLVMFPIFGFIIVNNIWVHKQNSEKLLLEKGAALIRSFEAGTRTGMMGTFWNSIQLQRLLTETARQPDIEYLLVADSKGMIVSHSDEQMVGKSLDFVPENTPEFVNFRIYNGTIDDKDGKIFEVYRKFMPSNVHPQRHGSGHGKGWGRNRREFSDRKEFMEKCLGLNQNRAINFGNTDYTIFVGLNMETVIQAETASTRQAILFGAVLLLVGTSGILLLFVVQNYRNARLSLTKIKAYSDTIVNNMPISLLYVDDDNNVLASNPSSKYLFGAPEYLENPELPPEVMTFLNCVKNECKSQVDTELDINIGGKTINVEISAAKLVDETDGSGGYILLIKDLTEIHRLREEIELSKRLASVGSLAAGVAHEIRNPLSSVKGFATYFMEKYKDIPEDKDIARIMIQETERLNRVVSQLLEFSKPVSIDKKPVNIKAFTEDSLKLIEIPASKKNVDISFAVKSEIDEVMIDSDRMNQVFLNIFLNSIESIDGKGTLQVELEEGRNGKGVFVKIKDTGCGIKPEDIDHIFDPYFTTRSSGTGIGLAIVHNIIESHGGDINVSSVVGEGTTVTVFLPYIS